MATFSQIYAHQDDDPGLAGDDLVGKVLRYIQCVALVDTSELSVFAVGRTIVLTGYVSSEAEIGCIEDAAAAVIGVRLIENKVEVRSIPH